MSTPNDGGPAFPFDWVDFQPTTGDQVVREQFPGMSLRMWLAAHASEADIGYYLDREGPCGIPKYTREEARFIYADAMIKAGAK